VTTGSDGPRLATEPVTGWRVWRLIDDDAGPRLGSITVSGRWSPREPFVATCAASGGRRPPGRASSSGGHRVPDEACSCGVYAASTPEHLANSGAIGTTASVVGTVAMWGTVVEHDAGARSAFAYPARVRLVCATCLSDGRGAVVPRFVVGTGDATTALCRRHGLGRAGSRQPAADVEARLLSTYAVDLLPLEPVASTMRDPVPPTIPHDARRMLERIGQALIMGVGVIVNIVMAIVVLWGIVNLLYGIVATAVELVT
jgi:hypothetical protein